MSWAFFLGCTVPVRNLNYEVSIRRVAERLGLDLIDIPEFGCCGFPMKSVAAEEALLIAARNLGLAAREGHDVVAACSACAATLTEAQHTLDHDPALADKVNEDLKPLGLAYRPGVKVRHFTRLLYEEVGLDQLKQAITRPLAGSRFAPHYGCHYLKPAEIMDHFDSVENPRSLSDLIQVTGAESVDYQGLKDCCGGGVLGANEEIAQSMAHGKLSRLNDMGVTGLVVICPFCNVMYEGQQKSIAKKFDTKFKVPLFFYPQVLGLAMGFSPDEMGFKLNRVKDKDFLKSLGEK